MTGDSPKPAMSTSESVLGAEAVVFRAKLTPHRSLSRKGLMILFACVIAITTVISIPFYILGAMPVVGFLGLDVVLLWIAFRVSNQRARAYEELVLTHIELLFSRMTWRGRRSEWRFNPLWVKVASDNHEELGMQRLALVEGRQQVELGAFLGAEEKADFAGALKAALVEARKGPRFG